MENISDAGRAGERALVDEFGPGQAGEVLRPHERGRLGQLDGAGPCQHVADELGAEEMVAPLVRDVKPAERGAEDAVMIELALEQHGAHAGLYGLTLPGRDGEAVDRAGDVRVAGHVAPRAVLPHQARRQGAARVQPRKAVYLPAGAEPERDVGVLVARQRADES